MSFGGGGFFGSGKSDKRQTSTVSDLGQQLNESTGSTAIGLSNLNLGGGKNSNVNLSLVSSDYGAIGRALELTEKNMANSSAFATDGVSMVSKSLNDTANLAYDGLNIAGSVAQRGLDNAANLAYDGLSKVTGLAADVINIGGVQNLEFLGQVANFSELAGNHWLESAKLSDAQARYAMDYTAKENSQNRAMLSDAMDMTAAAYLNANRGLEAMTSEFNDRLAATQNEALNTVLKNSAMSYDYLSATQNAALSEVAKNSQAAQSASTKAMDYVFQSTKSADERTVQDTTKWIMGGLIAVVALVVVAPMLKGG